jgi:hypothetical protein
MEVGHRGAVIDLWREALLDATNAPHAAERFDWFYRDNPAGPPLTTLCMADGETSIAGSASIFPRDMRVGGEVLRVGVAADFSVRPAHRVAGCALTLQRALARRAGDGGFAFVYGYPNEAAFPIFARIGWHVLGDALAYSKPLRTASRLRDLAPAPRLEALVRRPEVAAVAGALLDLGLSALDTARILPSLLKYRIEERARADARFDELWSRRQSDPIQGVRSSAYLNWRYAGLRSAGYRFVSLVERSTGALAAYLVYASDGEVALVADLFAPRLDRVVDVIVLHLALRLRRTKVRTLYVTYFGDEALGRRLEALQFFRRPPDRRVIVYVPPGTPTGLAQLVVDPKRWMMFDGELDP